ncbi:MAG: hypothetical protein NTV48_00295, partial [Candidatus Vogelbacteria bacterium]|nr:hypothetical protein [Candidatus Vogelbacteria bacterium]
VVAIRIKMAGDFFIIFKALKLLENLPFAIDFNKVAMQKNTTGALATEKVLPWSADIDFSAKTGKK